MSESIDKYRTPAKVVMKEELDSTDEEKDGE